ncbi:FAD/NAD-binding domain-containing protein [Coprinopsis marcescibilis]|uniref:Kynurenine 3-monooxygenase n=1 Tax=Coprinopsis marcescibilis TaxID=230819 RepID=A0A5C3LMA7_COPMA|nr:FAD/NAD-binding domain-containing protein [Coprinopsis marcescibilis]
MDSSCSSTSTLASLLPGSRRAVVIGAGPVGCLTALALAKRGWRVDLFEGRPDLRLPSSKASSQQRSINLAISHRGLAALEAIEPAAAERFLHAAIPMRGRMIHTQPGGLDSQLYDRDGQCIHSIDRALLNEGLLEEVTSSENVRTFFNHRVTSVDFEERILTVRDTIANQEVRRPFDFCVGADGSYSIVRRQMMRVLRMDYHQEYIGSEYVELKMPAGRDRDGNPAFLLDPNHLHIWPRHSFMLIALPNKDKTFTCTLFAPTAELDRLNTPDTVLTWFKFYFPDAVRAIGEEILIADFLKNPRSSLICTKAKPYHYLDRGVILGDAAHSMVPFYGQGLNCGLEDVRVLTTLMDQEGVIASVPESPDRKDDVDRSVARALERYTEGRHRDLVAISDLAMDNYLEMRHSVTTLTYIVKKVVDNILYSLTSRKMISLSSLCPTLSRMPYPIEEPRGWIPLYTMVTFRPDISYATAKVRAERQAAILEGLVWAGIFGAGVACAWAGMKLRRPLTCVLNTLAETIF